MSYQEDRERRIAIFEDTIGICEREQRLLCAIRHTRNHATVWDDILLQEFEESKKRYEDTCDVEVSEKRMLEIVYSLKEENPDCRVGILNIASPINPGGDVLRGGDTVEESLCRCSTLYPSLKTETLWKQYYEKNRVGEDAQRLNAFIYTPDVVFFKRGQDFPILMQEKDWFLLDVISSAVPETRVEESLEPWMKGIFSVAAKQEIDILVLNTSGCAIFEGLPHVVEDTFKKALQEYKYSFRAVHFMLGN